MRTGIRVLRRQFNVIAMQVFNLEHAEEFALRLEV